MELAGRKPRGSDGGVKLKWKRGDYVLGSRWEGGVDSRSVPREAKVPASLSTGPRMGCPSVRLSSYTVRMDPKGDTLLRDLEAGLTNAESLLSLFFFLSLSFVKNAFIIHFL